MAFNISDFINNASGRKAFSRSAHFQLQIVLPPALSDNYSAKNLTFSVASANIPGIGIDTTAVRRGGTSQLEYFPINVTFGDLNMMVLSDGQAEMLNLFKDWLASIYMVGGLNGTAQGPNAFMGNSYRVSYREDYQATISLTHYNPEGDEIVKYTFYEAFPERVSDMNLSWAALNEVLSIPVTFKYRYYTTNSPNTPPAKVGVKQQAQVTKLPIQPAAKTVKAAVQPLIPGGGSFGGGGATGSWS